MKKGEGAKGDREWGEKGRGEERGREEEEGVEGKAEGE